MEVQFISLKNFLSLKKILNYCILLIEMLQGSTFLQLILIFQKKLHITYCNLKKKINRNFSFPLNFKQTVLHLLYLKLRAKYIIRSLKKFVFF